MFSHSLRGGCAVTLSGRVELLRQQVIAAAHAAERRQLGFSHKHPQGAGSQVATRVQPDHDGVLEFGESTRTEREKERKRSGEERRRRGGDRW